MDVRSQPMKRMTIDRFCRLNLKSRKKGLFYVVINVENIA